MHGPNASYILHQIISWFKDTSILFKETGSPVSTVPALTVQIHLMMRTLVDHFHVCKYASPPVDSIRAFYWHCHSIMLLAFLSIVHQVICIIIVLVQTSSTGSFDRLSLIPRPSLRRKEGLMTK